MKNTLSTLLASVLFILWVPAQTAGAPLGTSAFTYQGQLTDGDNPANGTYDLTFTLFDAAGAGMTVGTSNVVNDLAITNGLFTTTLDFGPGVFAGNSYWLEVAVRPGASTGAYTNVVPRQALTPSPYALYALNAGTAALASSVAPNSITSASLAPGSVNSNQLAAGSVHTSILADDAVDLSKLNPGPVGLLATIIANPTPGSQDNFGIVVAALGTDRVLIGTAFDDVGGTDAGGAYLYSVSGTLLMTFTNPTPASMDNFGFSLAPVGTDRVLIGAYNDDTAGGNAGAAYLFTTNGVLQRTFTKPAPVATADFFGYAVAGLGTDRVVISAYNDDTGANNAGTVYLFNTNGTILTTITNPTPAAIDHFGFSLATIGLDRILIGASGDDTGATDAGAVYLYTTNGTLLTTITNPTPASGDNFGSVLAAMGSDKVLVGVRNDDTGGTDAGAAYLFSTNGTLLMTFVNPSPASSDSAGASVAAVGTDKVLVGAVGDDTAANNAGGAYLFSTNGTLLSTITRSTQANAIFGNAVAAVGPDRLLIAAAQDAASAGTVYLFTVANPFGLWSKYGTNLFYSEGNVGIGTDSPQQKLHVIGNILASGTVTGSSDRNVKQDFAPVDSRKVLEKVVALPITTWRYIADANVRHLGPVAQDFYAAFNLGMDDTHISMVDADGVALAAIQGLNEKLEGRNQKAEDSIQKLTDELKRRDAENADLKARLEKLERLVNQLNGGAR